jgi:hypothetical protein
MWGVTGMEIGAGCCHTKRVTYVAIIVFDVLQQSVPMLQCIVDFFTVSLLLQILSKYSLD